MQKLDLWLSDIKKWRVYEACESRRVWLEVFGIPSHAWCWENFKKIGDLWGTLICLGKPIPHTDSFESMKILITLDAFHTIEQGLLFYGRGFWL